MSEESLVHLRRQLQDQLEIDHDWPSSESGREVFERAVGLDQHDSGGFWLRRGRMSLVAVSLVAAVSIVGGVAVTAAVRQESPTVNSGLPIAPSSENQASRSGVGSRPPGYFFNSIDQLVANSTQVLLVTVVSEGPGTIDRAAGYTQRRVGVEIEEKYLDSTNSITSSQLEIVQGGYVDGQYVGIDSQQPPLEVGEKAVLFLVNTSPNEYVLTGVPAAWRIDSNGVLNIRSKDDAVASQVDGRALSEVASELRRAISNTDLKPLPGGPSPISNN